MPVQSSVRVGAKPERADDPSTFTLTFGMYAGRVIHDVPRDYLEWLLDRQAPLVDSIRSHLSKLPKAHPEEGHDELNHLRDFDSDACRQR